MTRQLEGVFFDLDGTLLDTAPDFVATLNQLALEYDVEPASKTAIYQTVSDGARALTTLQFGLTENDEGFEERRLRLLSIYAEKMGKHCQLFEGMETLIKELTAANLYWGIITNKPWRFTEPLLERLHLPVTPDVVICPEHVTNTKPDPEPLYLACNKVKCSPENVIYIGDHKRDIDCGIRAGSKTIAVSFGYIHADDDIKSWQATHIADSTADISAIISTYIR